MLYFTAMKTKEFLIVCVAAIFVGCTGLSRTAGTETAVRPTGPTASANMEKALAQKFLPAASDMLTFTTISQKLHEMDVDADVAWTKLADRAAYDAYRKAIHAKMMAAMGEWPARTPLNARTVATVKKDGYRIEKVIFESMPNLFVTANLFVPESPVFKAPYPAIVMIYLPRASGSTPSTAARSSTASVFFSIM